MFGLLIENLHCDVLASSLLPWSCADGSQWLSRTQFVITFSNLTERVSKPWPATDDLNSTLLYRLPDLLKYPSRNWPVEPEYRSQWKVGASLGVATTMLCTLAVKQQCSETVIAALAARSCVQARSEFACGRRSGSAVATDRLTWCQTILSGSLVPTATCQDLCLPTTRARRRFG